MDHEMSEYYEVLQYLREAKVDRQYPYAFQNQSKLVFSGDTKVDLTDNHITNHNYSIILKNITADDTLVIQLDTPRNYDTTNFLQLFLISPTDNLNQDSITIGLSNSKTAVPVTINLTANTKNIPSNVHEILEYQMFKENTSPFKKNRRAGDIQSIQLQFNQSINELYISDILFRTNNYTTTLENLDYNIKSGKDYIKNQLYLAEVTSIPPTLDYLCYKAAAAYNWLTWWENEGKSMNDGTVNGENYASRLFDQINADINKYIEANPVQLDDQINTDMIGYSWIEGARHPTPNCLAKGSGKRWR